MRVSRLLVFILSFVITFNSNAAEQILEPHAMIYFHVPLGGNAADDNNHSFGLRFDQTRIERGKNIDYNQLFSRNAVLDFRFGAHGVKSFEIAGTDYLQKFRVLKQNGESETSGEVIDQSAEEVFNEAEEAQEETTFKDELESMREAVRDTFSGQLTGILIGVGLGIGLLVGAGD